MNENIKRIIINPAKIVNNAINTLSILVVVVLVELIIGVYYIGNKAKIFPLGKFGLVIIHQQKKTKNTRVPWYKNGFEFA